MRAAVQRAYGPPERVTVEEIDRPVPGAGQLLVRVRAAGLNPLDWYLITGQPRLLRAVFGLRRPKRAVVGAEFAGVVEAVADDVTRYAIGDEVWGHHSGTCAEYVVVDVDDVVPKPVHLSFEQAGGVAVAATTAIQGLRDHADLQPGQRIVVVGASGGVGTFAVQMAKQMGADVTGVCSARNADLVRSLGADRVIDYTSEDWCDPATSGPYDVVFDNVGDRPLAECRRVLTDDGTYVMVGAPKGGPILGPLRGLLPVMVTGRLVSHDVKTFTAANRLDDLRAINEMFLEGGVVPVVDRTYTLDETGAAMAHLGTSRARGKIVVVL